MKNLKNFIFAGILLTGCSTYNQISNSTKENLKTLEVFEGKIENKEVSYESNGLIHLLVTFDKDSTITFYKDNDGDFEVDVAYSNKPFKTNPQKTFNKYLTKIQESRPKIKK